MTRWLTALVLIALLAAGAYGVKIRWLAPKPVPVRITVAVMAPVEETVTASSVGTVKPVREVVCSAEVTGKILRIHAREGDRVRAGAQTIEIDHADTDARRAAAQADIAVARAELARARVASRNAEEEYSLIEHQRRESVISEQERLRAKAARDAATEAIPVAEARVAQLEAMLRTLDVALARATITAPFDGTVTQLWVEEGESVTPGARLCEVMDLSRNHVRAPIDEVDIGKVRLGQPVRLQFEAFPGETISSTVTLITPLITTAIEKNRTAEIEAPLDDPGGRYKVGMSTDVTVVTASKPTGLAIPTKSIRDRTTVLVVVDGRIVSRRIQAGLANWATTEILEGVTAGEQVVSLLDLEEAEEVEGREAVITGTETMPEAK
ncbi:MAG: efflux RND transporter periplasmic adaptor subunit [Planctomycetes bacterium]|nr:efflux RND transporter periplasmic adaptor subunit [Planctomycetota bacterium]